MRFTVSGASVAGVCLICLIASGCGGGPRSGPPGPREEEWHAPVQMLLHYAGADGQITRVELEEGLKADFAAADVNRSGVLEADEMRAVNLKRWEEDKSAVSPLQDWNGDGVIDFNEFAAGPRALFRELDRNHDGVLSANELRAGRGLGPESKPGGGGGPDGRQDGDQGRRGGPPGGGRGPRR